MDDAAIQKLRAEVLAQLDAPGGGGAARGDLESRVAALEGAVAQLLARGERPGASPAARVHPALGLLGPLPNAGDRCVMEPDKPCVQSHACRVLGH